MKISIDCAALWTGIGLCLLLGACASASAEPSSQIQEAERQATERKVPPLTDAERDRLKQALAPKLSRSSRGLEATRTRAGTYRIDLHRQFQHMTVAVRDADGKVSQQCVSTPEELDQLLRDKQARDRRRMGSKP